MNFLDCDANFKREQISWLKPFVVEIIPETEISTIDYNDRIIRQRQTKQWKIKRLYFQICLSNSC